MDGEAVCRLLGKNIRHFRALNQWSQEQLAEKIDVSSSFLSNIETGRAWVSPKTIGRLADAFSIEPGELFTPLQDISSETQEILKAYSDELRKSITRTITLTEKHFLAEG
jgi:transcriptional regulator with XRE-family HTH domain